MTDAKQSPTAYAPLVVSSVIGLVGCVTCWMATHDLLIFLPAVASAATLQAVVATVISLRMPRVETRDEAIRRVNAQVNDWISHNGSDIPAELLHLLSNLDHYIREQ